MACAALLLTGCTALKPNEFPPDATTPTKDSGSDDASPSDASDASLADASDDAQVCGACDAGSYCDPTMGTCVDCPVLASDASDFYVDVNSPFPVGTAACPFTTITSALAAASASSAPSKTVHVAAGTYGTKETFPLAVRGVSLVGASAENPDAGETLVRGTGLVTGSEYWARFQTTVLTGDPTASSRIAGLTLEQGNEPDGGWTTPEQTGVWCDLGNAPPMGGTDVSPNTLIDTVTFGPGYVIGVELVARAQGCNLAVRASTFLGGSAAGGVLAAGIGCGSPYGDPLNPPHTIAVTVGDGTSAGQNLFRGFTEGGIGVSVAGCTSRAIVNENVIEDGYEGVFLSGATDPLSGVVPSVTVQNTVFQSLEQGLVIDGAGLSVDLSDDVFESTHAPTSASTGGPAVSIPLGSSAPARVTSRGSTFLGNDIGLYIGSGWLTDSIVVDFGTVTSPGGNVFACNSAPAAAVFEGADVWVAASSDGGSLSLDGNSWANGTPSIVLTESSPPSVSDTSPGTATATCPP